MVCKGIEMVYGAEGFEIGNKALGIMSWRCAANMSDTLHTFATSGEGNCGREM